MVTIAAHYWTPHEAELDRLRLEFSGIRAVLADVALPTLFWHYALAIGGIRLMVPKGDAARARAILAERAGESAGTRACLHCGTELPQDWQACWRCGADREGSVDPQFFMCEQRVPGLWEQARRMEYRTILTLVLLALVLTAPPVLLLILVAFVLSPARLDDIDETPVLAAPEPDAAEPVEEPATSLGDALSLRAITAALFGITWFSPLLVLAFMQLKRFDPVRTPASPRFDRLRTGAWCFIALFLAALLLVLAFAAWSGAILLLFWDLVRLGDQAMGRPFFLP